MIPPYRYTSAEINVASTPEQIGRDQQLANICVGCHSSTVPANCLRWGQREFRCRRSASGGVVFTNLTPSRPLKEWTDDKIIRAIRAGGR